MCSSDLIGLGAVSLDITIALIVTSLLRRHLSRRLWRAVHLLAYASWPVAWLHSISASTDMRHGWLFLLGVGCALAVVIAVLWRLSAASRDVPRAERVGLLMSAVHDRTSLRGKLSGRDKLTGPDTPAARDAAVPSGRIAAHERTSRR